MGVLDKHNPEWEMWQDIFKFRKKYYIAPVRNDEWQLMLEEMYSIAGKYEKQPFYKLCTEILLDIADEMERSVRNG